MEDLDVLRDEKCFPIAQTILTEISTGLFEENGVRDVALKALALTLNEDLNISQDMNYIPQLILGVFSGANATVQTCTTVPLDEERYKGIARKMLVILAEENLKLNIKADETVAVFAGVKAKCDILFLEEKLNILEVKYIMDSIFNYFAMFNNMLGASIQDATEKATAKLFGIESTNDLTMKKLDEVLRKL